MNKFEQIIIKMYGDLGESWLTRLPQLVEHLSRKWGLSAIKPMSNLSYNYVASAMQDSRHVILKLGLDIDSLKCEAEALKAFASSAAVKLFAQEDGALLLERALPGDSLRDYYPGRDIEAVQIACDIIKRLHQVTIKDASNFFHISDWLKSLDGTWDIPMHYLQKARSLRDELLLIQGEPVLLHGDLHHDNILKNDNDWVVIDPKGVVGYTVNEIWAFINNPMPYIPVEIIIDRIKEFGNRLNIDCNLIISWCFVQSVLSWVWDLEDNLQPSSIWLTSILNELRI
jgi:streptomycin 6-kinase